MNVRSVASKITDFLTEPDVLHLRTFVQMGKCKYALFFMYFENLDKMMMVGYGLGFWVLER